MAVVRAMGETVGEEFDQGQARRGVGALCSDYGFRGTLRKNKKSIGADANVGTRQSQRRVTMKFVSAILLSLLVTFAVQAQQPIVIKFKLAKTISTIKTKGASAPIV